MMPGGSAPNSIFLSNGFSLGQFDRCATVLTLLSDLSGRTNNTTQGFPEDQNRGSRNFFCDRIWKAKSQAVPPHKPDLTEIRAETTAFSNRKAAGFFGFFLSCVLTAEDFLFQP
jgi:hypothetical protein